MGTHDKVFEDSRCFWVVDEVEEAHVGGLEDDIGDIGVFGEQRMGDGHGCELMQAGESLGSAGGPDSRGHSCSPDRTGFP